MGVAKQLLQRIQNYSQFAVLRNRLFTKVYVEMVCKFKGLLL